MKLRYLVTLFTAVSAASLYASQAHADEGCFPPCRTGYLCSPQKTCVSECNPPCGAGEMCAHAQCVTKTESPADPAQTPVVAPPASASSEPTWAPVQPLPAAAPAHRAPSRGEGGRTAVEHVVYGTEYMLGAMLGGFPNEVGYRDHSAVTYGVYGSAAWGGRHALYLGASLGIMRITSLTDSYPPTTATSSAYGTTVDLAYRVYITEGQLRLGLRAGFEAGIYGNDTYTVLAGPTIAPMVTYKHLSIQVPLGLTGFAPNNTEDGNLLFHPSLVAGYVF